MSLQIRFGTGALDEGRFGRLNSLPQLKSQLLLNPDPAEAVKLTADYLVEIEKDSFLY